MIEISNELGKSKSSFFTNPFYLLDKCYFEYLDGALLVGQESVKRKGEFNLINIPKSIKFLNKYRNLTLLFEEEISDLESNGFKITNREEIWPEFFYKTDDFINMDGSDFSHFRKKIHRLERENTITILNNYDIKKVANFIKKWKEEKKKVTTIDWDIKNLELETDENIQALRLLDTLPNKSFFIEVNGKLEALRITVPLTEKLWGGIYQKVNHEFKGLTELLYLYSAKGNENRELFTTGAAGHNEGIMNFKRQMHLYKEKMLYFVSGELKQ